MQAAARSMRVAPHLLFAVASCVSGVNLVIEPFDQSVDSLEVRDSTTRSSEGGYGPSSTVELSNQQDYLSVDYAVEVAQTWGGQVGFAPNVSTPWPAQPFDCSGGSRLSFLARTTKPQSLPGRAHLRVILYDTDACSPRCDGETSEWHYGFFFNVLGGGSSWTEYSARLCSETGKGGASDPCPPGDGFVRPKWAPGETADGKLDAGDIGMWSIQISIDGEGSIGDISAGAFDIANLSCTDVNLASVSSEGGLGLDWQSDARQSDARLTSLASARLSARATTRPPAFYLVSDKDAERTALQLGFETDQGLNATAMANYTLTFSAQFCNDSLCATTAHESQTVETLATESRILQLAISYPRIREYGFEARIADAGASTRLRVHGPTLDASLAFRPSPPAPPSPPPPSFPPGTPADQPQAPPPPPGSPPPLPPPSMPPSFPPSPPADTARDLSEICLTYNSSSPSWELKPFLAAGCAAECRDDAACLYETSDADHCYMATRVSSVVLSSLKHSTVLRSAWMDSATKRGMACSSGADSKCACNGTTIDCSARDLAIVPLVANDEATTLDFGRNPGLTMVADGMLGALPKVTTISFLHTPLQYISSNALHSLPSLSTLVTDEPSLIGNIASGVADDPGFVDVCCERNTTGLEIERSDGSRSPLYVCDLASSDAAASCEYVHGIAFGNELPIVEFTEGESSRCDATSNADACGAQCAGIYECTHFTWQGVSARKSCTLYSDERFESYRPGLFELVPSGDRDGYVSGRSPQARANAGRYYPLFSDRSDQPGAAGSSGALERVYQFNVALGEAPMLGAVWLTPQLTGSENVVAASITPGKLVYYADNWNRTQRVRAVVRLAPGTTVSITLRTSACDEAFLLNPQLQLLSTLDFMAPRDEGGLDATIVWVLGALAIVCVVVLLCFVVRSLARTALHQRRLAHQHRYEAAQRVVSAVKAVKQCRYPAAFVRLTVSLSAPPCPSVVRPRPSATRPTRPTQHRCRAVLADRLHLGRRTLSEWGSSSTRKHATQACSK